MAFAALHLPAFPLQALLRAEPALAHQACAVVEGEGKQAVVLHATAAASALTPGLPATLALARAPQAVFRPRDLLAELETQRLLVASAFALSPRVENTRAGTVLVDWRGADRTVTHRHARRLQSEGSVLGLDLRLGFGPSPTLADLASQAAAPWLEVTDRAAFLNPLPLAAASPSRQQVEILQKWGLHTLGDLTALPKAEIGQRLGREGAALWERAAGLDERPLQCVEPVRTFVASWRCEPPIESLEPLLFRLRRFAERLASELRAAHLAARALALTLELEDAPSLRRDFLLPQPSTEVELWVRVLHQHLETVRTTARVCAVRVVADPAPPPHQQTGLFDTGLRDVARFHETLARLAALVGAENVGTPARLDSHRPEAYTLQRPPEVLPAYEAPPLHPPLGPAWRRFRPAPVLSVLFAEERPVALADGPTPGPIRATAGPWLTGGEGWTPTPWQRTVWWVRQESGHQYQIAEYEGCWHLEAVLD